ncbi:MAG: hypothetical protein H7196_02945 [candidate division SR1 bacterium]|nr:hypothetical protein [candidate division SR1 bacterium]
MTFKHISLLKKLFLMHNLGFDHDYVVNKQSKGSKNKKILKYNAYKLKWFQLGTTQKSDK